MGQPDFCKNPFEGTGCADNREHGAVVSVNIDALDMRESPHLLTPEALHGPQGMCLLPHKTSVKDFNDQAEIAEKYHPEILELAKKLTGCDRAVFVSHVVRVSDGAAMPTRPAAHMAHNDYNDRLKEQFLGLYEAKKDNILSSLLTEDELKNGRLVVMNFWRPTQEQPLQRNPLGVCDPSTMKPEDILEYVHDPQPPPAMYKLPLPVLLSIHKHKPEHKWYYPSGMTRDEVLCFKNYDSANKAPLNGVGIHGCLTLANTPEDAPTRQSIEARVLCWFAPN